MRYAIVHAVDRLNGCGAVGMFYDAPTPPVSGQWVKASQILLLDGNRARPLEPIVCGACNRSMEPPRLQDFKPMPGF